MTDDTCVLHPGRALVWCRGCITEERELAAADVAELVDDLQFTVDRLMEHHQELAVQDRLAWIRLGQIRRRLVDRAASQA